MKRLEERRKLHGMTIEQLQAELATAQRELMNNRFDAGMNRLTNSAGMHNTRKRIAVLQTLIRQRELLTESGFSTMDEYKTFKIAERKAYRASQAR